MQIVVGFSEEKKFCNVTQIEIYFYIIAYSDDKKD